MNSYEIYFKLYVIMITGWAGTIETTFKFKCDPLEEDPVDSARDELEKQIREQYGKYIYQLLDYKLTDFGKEIQNESI